ncbi:hypothetical protein PFY12_05800 [Chryseobacterium camelliae]|uniref:Secretion system C-terminal sorting domain-containing protein n=1 Tax=Chryseobacterium camelliae TaxID=1265445 RepID=A0ABY7QPQ9_9FLAO|nr:hypothetical protein [Chryseobacterium camelliae]WBV61635.1 hypothetical protein PFY12_05800 [Chryseobacterium camelliae]
MKAKFYSLLSTLIGVLGFSQIIPPPQPIVYFSYDEAGNQVFRGDGMLSRTAQTEEIKPEVQSIEAVKGTTLSSATVIDEKAFWKQIRLYPVPVNDYLTIDWTDEVDGLIESVSLYQHSTIHWKFQQQNTPGLNKQLKINMTGYDWGVYVIRFTLKDGRIFSKNITKR